MRHTPSGAAETGEVCPEPTNPSTRGGLSGSPFVDPSGGGGPAFFEPLEVMKGKVTALDRARGDVEATRVLLTGEGDGQES